ncbi:MAG: AI-2E family transporter [Candidatus Nomurabacteria bacterium]|nr:AI-2E family transporter [Candidatus Nomurabacteria bacterium]
MNNQKSEFYFLFTLLLIVFILVFFVFKPFIYPIILAVVFTTVFGSIHNKVLYITKQNKGLSAFITTLIVIITVITPFVLFSNQIFKEATILYSSIVNNGGLSNLSVFITSKLHILEKNIPIPVDISFSFDEYLKSVLNWFINNTGSLFSNIISIAGSSLIFIITLYYLFKDGKELKEYIIKLSPLKYTHDQTIFTKLSLDINSVIIGSLLIAILQGIFIAIGFILFGIPNAVLWGSIAMFAALIPGIGTSLIVVPAIIFLFFKGNASITIGFAIWGFTVVSIIDNILKPKIIQRAIMIHPLLILLSVLGGIIFFGPLGLLIGPSILDLLFVLLEIYSSIQE